MVLDQQSVDATLEPVLLAERQFLVVEMQRTGSRLGSESALELPWWKRGNSGLGGSDLVHVGV